MTDETYFDIFNQVVKYSEDSLDRLFFALSDPTRRDILARLAKEGELIVTALAEPYAISLPAVSKHLRVLERAGLLVQHKDGRIRRCQMVHGPLLEADRWIEQYRHFWKEQLDSLAGYLTQIQGDEARE